MRSNQPRHQAFGLPFLSLLCASMMIASPASAQSPLQYEFRVLLNSKLVSSPGAFGFSLNSLAPITVTRGAPYGLDFQTLVAAVGAPQPALSAYAFSWTDSNNLSGDGVTFDGDHTLSGTPMQVGTYAFDLLASVNGISDTETYTLVVEGVALEVVQIAAGYDHSCAVLSDATARCWGSNSKGQLGTGNTDDSSFPVPVTGLSGVVKIFAGPYKTCAIVSGGGLKCWGDNYLGQAGIGSNAVASILTPMDVVGLGSGVTDVSISDHVCAIHTGAAKCWGRNAYGQLGVNYTFTEEYSPVQVMGLASGVTSIAAGGFHSCAVHAGAAKCWGRNNYGQLGDGSTTNRPEPTLVSGLGANVKQVVAGSLHACAVAGATNDVSCWGHNGYGQIGRGDAAGTSTVPVTTVGATGAEALTTQAWADHTCAKMPGDDASCWGSNDSGEIGDGTIGASKTVATNVPAPSGISQVAVGGEHTCFRTDNTMHCVGWNLSGQLGDGTQNDSVSAVQVIQ